MTLRCSGPLLPLPWQWGVLGLICGLLARTFPESVLVLCLAALVHWRALPAMLLGCVLGLWTGTAPQPDPGPTWHQTAHVRGIVDEVRTQPGRISLVLRDVRNLQTNEKLPGKLLWTWQQPPLIPEPGQSCNATLRIRELRGRENFGQSSSEQHWSRQDVRHRTFSQGPADVAWDHHQPSLRARLLHHTSALLPPGQAGAGIRALVFGDRALLDPTFMDRVRRGGLAHSLALSGLHLALVACFGYALAWLAAALCPSLLLRLPRQKLGALLSLPLALSYLWLGGLAPSLLRAALMLCAATLHLLRNSRSHPQDSLFTAVAMLILYDPLAVHDLSLQLSVLAVAGIVLFLPVFTSWTAPLGRSRLWRLPRFFLLLGATTLCANLFILPVQILYFTELPAQIWLNLLWLPLLSFWTLPLSFLGLGLTLVWPWAASACLDLAGLGFTGLDWLLLHLDRAGWLQAVLTLRPCGIHVVGYWTMLLAGHAAWQGGSRKAILCLGLGLALMAGPGLWQQLGWNQPLVELTVLDTGMSQAVLVRSASGKAVLIDGGGSWNADYDPGRAVVAPALAWKHPPRLHGAALSHLDADHVRGLFYILEHVPLDWFAWTGLIDASPDHARLQSILDNASWPILTCRGGDRIFLEPDLWLEALHPGPEEQGVSENETSLVLRLVWRGQGLALIPGDVEKRSLRRIMATASPMQAEVLVLPHHGSKSSLLPGLYRQIKAKWAVAACGPHNRFGFPHPDVVRACEQAGMTVLSTAEHGGVCFQWKKDGLRLHTARSRHLAARPRWTTSHEKR